MFFVLSLAWDKEKIFLYFFTDFKTCHLSYSIYKHDAIDIADPNRMQNEWHLNFALDLSVAQWQRIEARNP